MIPRRKFLKSTLAAGALAWTGRGLKAGTEIPKRRLGRTEARVSIVGMPGWHLGRMKDEGAAIRMIRLALDRGVDFFDSAWEYVNGESDLRLGKALHDRRDRAFLMTKSRKRDREGSRRELEESLRRMRTDYLDLWQFHAVGTVEEVEEIMGPGGAMETAEKARKEGKIRYVGFTGHRDHEAHLHFISRYGDVVETVQMPVNPVDPHYGSFLRTVLPAAVEKDVGVIAMKTVCNGVLVADGIATAAECHRYAWSQPVATLVAGMDTFGQLEEILNHAASFKPYGDREEGALLDRVRPHAGIETEFYKTPSTRWRVYPREPLL